MTKHMSTFRGRCLTERERIKWTERKRNLTERVRERERERERDNKREKEQIKRVGLRKRKSKKRENARKEN